ncbi:MAG: exo-alpha-sialidase [Planctomycetes bacterium]|nr:exo-alpha-sialidase [Planctomycetota bacterium]
MTTPSKNLMLLGTRKGLFIFELDGNSTWQFRSHTHIGIPIAYAMLDHRSGILWACQDHGHWGQKLVRSRDLGETWEEVTAPAYPDGEQIINSFATGGKTEKKPATLRYLWCMAEGGDDRPDRLFIGTEPGGLFVSEDGGDSWSLVRGLWDHPSRTEGNWFGGGRDDAGIHSIIIDPNDSARILIGVSCAGVFESTDDGTTWNPRNTGLRADFLPNPDAEVGQDPHLVVMCPSHTDALWQQNHCGIFRSTDGAKTWQDAGERDGGPANFGFAIAVDQRDPDTAWVVPGLSDERRVTVGAALVVCRTEDGGKSWQQLRNGLPQDHAYDIVYRHALDLHGETLAFGSTTGNVYTSLDRGDTWHCLGTNLPPVYSIRFAVAHESPK